MSSSPPTPRCFNTFKSLTHFQPIPVRITSRKGLKLNYSERSIRNNVIRIPLVDAQDIPNSNNERRLPNVLILNTRSLVSKTDELANFVELYKSNLVFVTETWLCDKIPDEAIQLPGMTSIRKDRIGRRGGGVVLYISNSIPTKTRHDFSQSPFECLWAILRPTWLPRCISRIAVAVAYLPPSTTSEDVERFYDYFYSCYDILISESPSTSNGFRPAKLARYSKLKQIIRNPTRGSNILDLLFTDISTFFETPKILAPIATSDHATILLDAKVHVTRKNAIRKVKVRPLKQSSLQGFEEYLKHYDWLPVLSENNVDSKVDSFLEITHNITDFYFPTKIIKVRQTLHNWKN